MKTRATPTDDADDRIDQIDRINRIETYARTNSDGQPELVLYNPDETREWINATRSTTVELEEYR